MLSIIINKLEFKYSVEIMCFQQQVIKRQINKKIKKVLITFIKIYISHKILKNYNDKKSILKKH